MANENNVNARISQKHDIEANWLKSVYTDGIKENGLKSKPFIPKAAELIVYDPDENCSHVRFKIGDGVKNVDELEFANLTFKDVDERPKNNILENVIYRYTTTIENIYAISGARKNVVITDLGVGEKTYNIKIEVVDALPSTGTSVINVGKLDTTPITLYYNKNTRTVHAYVDFALKLALAVKEISVDTGWNNPSSVLGSSYKDIAFNSTLEAGYGEAGVVHEIITNTHADYYYEGQWYELPIEANEYLVKRLRNISKEKFDDKDNEANINVRAYKSINNDFDRVYVETANGEQSGDYCLTPKADTLPENPWVAAAADTVVRMPSIPVRNEQGEISVYIDDNSKGDVAVSKQYLEENTYQYVRRKPEEADAVSKANIVSAHTWTPDDNLYVRFAEPFSSSTIIPAAADATEETLVAIHSDSNASNSVQVIQDGDNYIVDCAHPASAQSKYRFIRKGTKNELVFSTDIKIAPVSDITNNRGFTMVAKNSITEDNSIWGGSNLSVEYAKGGDGYKLTFLGVTIPFDKYIGYWINLRIEMDALDKGSAARLYINNSLKISGVLTANVKQITAYDFMIYTWNNSNSGFRGNIYFDNMYFGDIPEAVKYSGYDTLTPVAYDYEDETIAQLNMDSLVLRKSDGTMLTKKDIPASADGRTVVSKHYVDNSVSMTTLPITYAELKQLRDNGMLTVGRFYRITDYICTTTQTDTRATNHDFDVIVQALSGNTLSENASADYHIYESEYKFDIDVIESVINKTFKQDRVKHHYIEYVDYAGGNYQVEPVIGSEEAWVTFDFKPNSEGVVVPVIYRADMAPDSIYFGIPDIAEPHYYVGTATIGNTVYDKWRKIETTTGKDFTWETEAKKYVYTDRIVIPSADLITTNLAAWELKYSLDNDTSRFAWADPGDSKTILMGTQEDEYIREPALDYLVNEYYAEQYPYAWIWSHCNIGDESIAIAFTSSEIYVDGPVVIEDFLLSEDGYVLSGGAESYGKTIIEYDEKTAGRGVIYYMKDEHNNECPYDFKNIQFKRDLDWQNGHPDFIESLGVNVGDVEWFYTFSWINENLEVEDLTLRQDLLTDDSIRYGTHDNKIKTYLYENKINAIFLNNILMINSYHINNGLFYGCNSNTFGDNCNSNTFGDNCHSNIFSRDCSYNIFGDDCFSNTFGRDCSYNIFGNYCHSNTFGNICEMNTFGPFCSYNTFGYNCGANTFGNRCQNNTFGNYCSRNIFDNSCSDSTFGNSCNSNTFGNNCNFNTFGNHCYSNTFGHSCVQNIFGNSTTNTISYVQHVRFENGCLYIKLLNSETGSDSNYVQDIIVSAGVRGTSSAYRQLQVSRNAAPVVFEAPNTKHVILD